MGGRVHARRIAGGDCDHLPYLAWNTQALQFGLLARYVANPRVHRCPSARHEDWLPTWDVFYCATINGQEYCTDYKLQDHPTNLVARITVYRDPTCVPVAVDLDWESLPRHGAGENLGFLDLRWADFSEHPVLYLLGLGWATHPLPPATWRAWKREPVITYDGKTYLQCPPLFTHQYSQAWVDFRDQREATRRILQHGPHVGPPLSRTPGARHLAVSERAGRADDWPTP